MIWFGLEWVWFQNQIVKDSQYGWSQLRKKKIKQEKEQKKSGWPCASHPLFCKWIHLCWRRRAVVGAVGDLGLASRSPHFWVARTWLRRPPLGLVTMGSGFRGPWPIASCRRRRGSSDEYCWWPGSVLERPSHLVLTGSAHEPDELLFPFLGGTIHWLLVSGGRKLEDDRCLGVGHTWCPFPGTCTGLPVIQHTLKSLWIHLGFWSQRGDHCRFLVDRLNPCLRHQRKKNTEFCHSGRWCPCKQRK